MTSAGLRTEIVDFAAVRRGGTAGRESLALRIFALWQPIFSHLDDKDFTFHLAKHVEDETAVQIRGLFGIDALGRDRALIIVRVHEHDLEGETWARLTVNAGFAPGLVQSRFGQDFLVLEAWRYRLSHPLRPFFVVDSAVSAASYCAYEKSYSGFAPTRTRAIPEEWWGLGEAGAAALGGERVEGARREVRRFAATVRDRSPRRPVSARSREAAEFYYQATGGDPAVGMLVMAPLSFPRYGYTAARYGWQRATRELR
jgi:hypothetical protein